MRTASISIVFAVATVLPGARSANAQQAAEESAAKVIALHRVELRPFLGQEVAPGSRSSGFVGAEATLRVSRLAAIALDGAVSGPFNATDAGPTPSFPLNETAWSSNVAVEFFPIAARARADEESGTLEAYLLAGIGAISARPVSVVDPVNRRFDYKPSVDFCFGFGARFFLARSFALTIEFRDILFSEQLENRSIATGSVSPSDSATWFGDKRFTQAFQLRLGASFFLGGR